MSREELSGPTAVAGAATSSRKLVWVSFGFGERAEHRAESIDAADFGGSADRYWLQKVTVVKGKAPEGLTVGCRAVRRERRDDGTRPPPGPEPQLEGHLESRLSMRPSDETALHASWQSQPWRVALLLTFSHSPAFWALAKEDRQATYLRLQDGSSASAADHLLERVVHRLYRARSRDGIAHTWDYLAYFEMLPRDVAHLREHLAELRDRRRNPLWAHVTREAELWMTKETKAPST